jgi:hypothetical protein
MVFATWKADPEHDAQGDHVLLREVVDGSRRCRLG